MGITNKERGQTLQVGGSENAFAGLCSQATQTLAFINTAQSIAMENVMSHVEQFQHSTSVDNDQIVMPLGLATVETHVEIHLDNGASNNEFLMWTELKEGAGAWTAVPFSNIRNSMGANTSLVISHARSIPLISSVRTIMRFRIQGDSTNLSLVAIPAAGAVPGVPSMACTIKAH